jgi:hypothetical protein
MARNPQIAASVSLLLLLSACAFSRYQYLSLEGAPGISVQRRGTPDLPRLHWVSACPVQYSLKRATYHLEFFVPSESYPYLPTLQIRARTLDGLPLTVTRQHEPRRCVSTYTSESVPGALDIGWFTCREATPEETWFSVAVLDESGALLGAERIPFTVEANGFYWFTDLP